MRLTIEEIKNIKQSIYKIDKKAKIYLFGSRVDNNKKGGDIDLIIISNKITYSDKIKIKLDIFKKMEEQKIDIVITRDINQPFVKIVLKEGILL